MAYYCSIHNDTPGETVMVYLGANTKVLKPILWTITGLATMLSSATTMGSIPGVIGLTVSRSTTLMVSVSTLTSAAGGLVTATNWALETLQNKLVADLSKGGYVKILSGESFVSTKKPPWLNMRVWVVRIQKTTNAIIIRRTNSSVWSGSPTGGSNISYNVMDRRYFSNWRTETIPIKAQRCDTLENNHEEEEDGYSMLDSRECFVAEELTSSWIQINKVVKNAEEQEIFHDAVSTIHSADSNNACEF